MGGMISPRIAPPWAPAIQENIHISPYRATCSCFNGCRIRENDIPLNCSALRAPAIQKTFAFQPIGFHAHVLDGFQAQAYSCEHEMPELGTLGISYHNCQEIRSVIV